MSASSTEQSTKSRVTSLNWTMFDAVENWLAPGGMTVETVLVEERPPEERPAGERLFATVEPAACPECGASVAERFCTRCGEKRVEERDYSLRHYLAEALNVFANLESPIPRSFFALVFRPGLLTAEYLAGRRKRYLKPLQIFVFCNLLFFFALSP